jgi:adenylylsulfate kinase-like enzyme
VAEKIKKRGVMNKINKPFSIWIIGPSAVGKTVTANLFYKKIIESNNTEKVIILDGDKMRNLNENKLGYDPVSRSKNTKRYMNLVKWLESFEISTIVSVISPFENDREMCRKEILNYKEIYLSCPMKERVKRDKKNLYKPALEGVKKNVIDVDIKFEGPKNCDLLIDTSMHKVDEVVNKILLKFNFL